MSQNTSTMRRVMVMNYLYHHVSYCFKHCNQTLNLTEWNYQI